MMNSTSDHRTKQNGRLNLKVDVSEKMDNNNNGEAEANQREVLVDWINSILPNLNLPIKASDEELRTCLVDGTILCRILNRLRPSWGGHSDHPSAPRSENIKKFLAAMDELGIPRFEISELEKGSMKTVMDCLLTLRAHSMPNVARDNYDIASSISISGSPRGDASSGGSLSPLSREDRRKVASDSKFQRNMRNPVMPEQSASLIHHVGHKFHEVFQMKQVCYADLPAAKISEMMKSNSLDNAPTQSLLSVVNGILDESVERKNGEIPHRVACLLRKVVQEIERRISTQAEHLRTQNNLFKAREDKYQSRIRVLEVLATGTSEETQSVMNQLQQIKQTDKTKMEEKKKVEDEDVVRLMKEREQYSCEISTLKQELGAAKKRNEQPNLQMETQAKGVQADALERIKELECHLVDSKNKVKELSEVEEKAKELERDLADSRNKVKELSEVEEKTKELERHLVDSRNKVKELAKFEERAKELERHLGDSNNKVKELVEAEERVKELEHHLEDSRNKVKELSEVEARAKELERQLVDSKNKVKDLTETEEKGVKELELHLTDYRNKVKELAQVEDRVKELEHHLTDKMKELSKVEERVKELEHRLTDKVKELAKVEERVKELERHLADSKNKVKEREEYYETKYESWNKKEHTYQKFIGFQFGELRKLKSCSDSIKQEILKTRKCYSEEFNGLGVKLKALAEAADNFHVVLAENRRLFNEVQDLKGNIRVFCRIRPFLRGQTAKQTTIDSIGENGELSFANPSKQGKESSRLFRFNKVFGPDSTQEEVYSDTQPFVRSVLDGYNACIFAYGQTGSGKTYTMTGPTSATEEDLGVNYRALNDLFSISQNRRSTISYEISVQMMEIYNEQVRDLLSNDGSRKKLGILATSQPNGLAVPDASMNPVTSTSDIMELMDIGLKNRAVGATAMNERSSRSHSIITIHVRGTDLKTGAALRGSLHLVDLAGSERVDRSEVTGDRLREAQHINKSLSALGDVIFSLSQKSSHVPYRNSKLTQVLQTSLGGQAKTLMFVQLNPDASSYTESLSTLKFAERVSGVELGAAKSSKEGRDVRELMDQVASLKDTIGKRDEEIERLQLLKDLKNVYPNVNNEKRGTSTLRYESSSPSKNSVGATAQRSLKPSSGKGLGHTEKAASDHDNSSDHSDKRSEIDSQHSNDDLNHPNDFHQQSNVAREEIGQDTPADADILEFRDADRLSDKSDDTLSVGTENDGSVEHNHHPVSEVTKPSHKPEKPKSAVKAALHKFGQTASATAKETTKVSTPTNMKRSATTSTLVKPTRRWT